MNRLLFLAPALLSIILSNSTQAAVVANFDITNHNFTPGTKTVTPVTNNSSITGTAVLDSAGIFTLDTVINVDVDYTGTAVGGLFGNIWLGTKELSYTFSGILTGNSFDVSSIASTQTSCVAIQGSFCGFITPNFIALTDPISFDLSIGQPTSFDIYVDAGLTSSEVGFHSYTVETSAVPLPAGIWLFGSAVIGLLGMKANRIDPKSL